MRSKPDVQRALAQLENRNVLVFDWGGGTLDLNLCRIAGGIFYQISTRGNNEVGGDRFDERLRNLIRDKHAKQHGIEDAIALEQPGASTALLTQCELAKIELSSEKTHTVLVRDYLRGSGGERNLAVDMSRNELEATTQDVINRGLTEIDAILEQARLDRDLAPHGGNSSWVFTRSRFRDASCATQQTRPHRQAHCPGAGRRPARARGLLQVQKW